MVYALDPDGPVTVELIRGEKRVSVIGATLDEALSQLIQPKPTPQKPSMDDLLS